MDELGRLRAPAAEPEPHAAGAGAGDAARSAGPAEGGSSEPKQAHALGRWEHMTMRMADSAHRHVARPGLPSTLEYPFVWRKGVLNGYSSTRVSLWDSLMFGRLAMGFANGRASRYGIR